MAKQDLGDPMTLDEYQRIVDETLTQPAWRENADKEADYADGNQLATELLVKQRELGIPPAKENIIGPAIKAVCGDEKLSRRDWRVVPDATMPAGTGDDIADALNFKLNQAERYSKADDALSAAFKPAASVGIGWVEVARAPNSMQYPYKCRYVHRNEIWWDMKAQEPDLSDARWLLRERWTDQELAARRFKKDADLIRTAAAGVSGFAALSRDGGTSTGLVQGPYSQRAWTTQEDHWFNRQNSTVLLSELWYRRWVDALVLKLQNGRAVEFNDQNPMHLMAASLGLGKVIEESLPRVRRAYWMGPFMLLDEPTIYKHGFFPYVPMFGFREDMTGVPFGMVRDMLFPQDNLNSSISKLRWGMGAVRTERTKGAVAMSDEQFRRTIARNDADIVLDAQKMAEPGARFVVKRDFELNAQQFQLMNDSRAAVTRVGVTTAFMGQRGSATSGVQEQTQVQQSQVSVADLKDGFNVCRKQVGELLLSMVIEDMGTEQQTVTIPADAIKPSRTIMLNMPQQDGGGGTYLDNDVQKARMNVALEDTPSTPSYRKQQLGALSEAVKSVPPDLQRVTLPFLLDLTDLPRKNEIVDAIRKAEAQPDIKTLTAQITDQVKTQLMHDLKSRALDLEERTVAANEKVSASKAVQTGVQASYSAMQAGAQIAEMPQIAPIADEVLKGAGYQRPNPAGVDPNFPVPVGAAVQPVAPNNTLTPGVPGVPSNTSPAFPPVPKTAPDGMAGIETASPADNLTPA